MFSFPKFRNNFNITSLWLQGIRNKHPHTPVGVISDEMAAIAYRENAGNAALIFISDDIEDTLVDMKENLIQKTS
jgi:hypothetical protein